MDSELSSIDKKIEKLFNKLITSSCGGDFTTAWAHNDVKYLRRVLKQHTRDDIIAERAFTLLINPSKEDEDILNRMNLF